MAKLADARDLKSRDTRVSYRFDPGFRHHYIAEWSSPVARRAHNPKVMWFKSHLRNHWTGPNLPTTITRSRQLGLSFICLYVFRLRFKLKRSFHVQFSMWPLFIEKMNVFFDDCFQFERCLIEIAVYCFVFQNMKKWFAYRIVIWGSRSREWLPDFFLFHVRTENMGCILRSLVAMYHQPFRITALLKSTIKGFHSKRRVNGIGNAVWQHHAGKQVDIHTDVAKWFCNLDISNVCYPYKVRSRLVKVPVKIIFQIQPRDRLLCSA